MKFNFKKKVHVIDVLCQAPDIENNCQEDGIFSPVAGIMGSLQANEVLKTILEFKNNKNMINFLMV